VALPRNNLRNEGVYILSSIGVPGVQAVGSVVCNLNETNNLLAIMESKLSGIEGVIFMPHPQNPSNIKEAAPELMSLSACLNTVNARIDRINTRLQEIEDGLHSTLDGGDIRLI
jgi:hypothetical protein